MKILKRLVVAVFALFYAVICLTLVIPFIAWLFFGFNMIEACIAHVEWLNDVWI
jgi:hypothetical protein